MMMGTNSSSRRYNPFTAAQWEELEQQALFYKYMVSGVPVPTDLILSVRRSLFHPASSSSTCTLGSIRGWDGSFQYNQLLHQMGVGGEHGRKLDLEPGRCRRTDGKKWRCSKDVYPDSKYCERHMHRGRNRSRKPVEFSSSSSTSTNATTTAAAVIDVSSLSPSAITLISRPNSNDHPLSSSTTLHSDHSFSWPFGLSSSNNTIQNNFIGPSYHHQAPKDLRYLQAMKGVGENERSAYFQQYNPYNTYQMAAASSSSDHQNSNFSFQNLTNKLKEQEQEAGKHCFDMGTPSIMSSEEANKSYIQTDVNNEENTHQMINKQPFHHFW